MLNILHLEDSQRVRDLQAQLLQTTHDLAEARLAAEKAGHGKPE